MQQPRLSISRLANLGASAIVAAFQRYETDFREITGRARARFEARDWHGLQADAEERLDLYRTCVQDLKKELRELLTDEQFGDPIVWVSIKAVYSGLITGFDDWELAETFLNSITRQVFDTEGVDERIEFVDTDFEAPPTTAREPVYRSYDRPKNTAALVGRVLADVSFVHGYRQLDADAAAVATRIDDHLKEIGALRVVDRTEIVRSVFYRGKWAYLVGRLFSGSQIVPMAIALSSTPDGAVVDAVLLDEDEISILFSFTRAYFHVAVSRPYDMVRFLKKVMPRKRIAELYISIGFNKHGKTELYRDILHHLAATDDRFQIAPGKKGMVMTVFTIPGYDVVFKIIKDTFTYPKKVTRREVLEKYHMVFRHDRAGRLADAQEFEHLKFARDRFSEELLAELLEVAGRTVEVEGEAVIIHHLYIERRMIPLDIYVQDASEEAAMAAVVDYGKAIKDLAASNIFPGDMMLKNFGVTRHGRVVFYDYDEIVPLTDCNFRHPPRPPREEDLFSDEPWFTVAENDVFPGEFPNFLGLAGRLMETFAERHGDLFTVDYWRSMQQRLRSGEMLQPLPYDPDKQLPRPAPAAAE